MELQKGKRHQWTLFKIREDIPKKWYFTGVSAATSYLDSIHKILKYCI